MLPVTWIIMKCTLLEFLSLKKEKKGKNKKNKEKINMFGRTGMGKIRKVRVILMELGDKECQKGKQKKLSLDLVGHF